MPVRSSPSRAGTGSLQKALRLVTELGAADAEGLRLTELVGRTNIDSSTAYRMLACFVDSGFLQKVEGKRYRLGPRVFELGLAAGQHFNAPSLAKQPLRQLADRIGATAFLNVRSGTETVYLERMEGPRPLGGLRASVGTRHPIGVGSGGIALLAAMEPAEADTLIQGNEKRYRAFGRNTLQVLRRHLEQAKADGYASTLSFLRPDIGGLGIIVPAAASAPSLAISVLFPATRMPQKSEFVSELRSAAAKIAQAMNGERTA